MEKGADVEKLAIKLDLKLISKLQCNLGSAFTMIKNIACFAGFTRFPMSHGIVSDLH